MNADRQVSVLNSFRFDETAECVSQGLIDIFTHIKGVPPLIVFDNATGVGRRIGKQVIETELFARFRAHYLFEVRFCNPASGWEKGNVERKVSFLRTSLLVPIPRFTDIIGYNAALLERCAFQEERIHYAKELSIGKLFAQDISALLSLPEKPFKAIRYEYCISDGWGNVCVDTCHTYSTTPENVRKQTIIAVEAHTVTALAKNGEILATHVRKFGKKKTKSTDPAHTIGLLIKKAWRMEELKPSYSFSRISLKAHGCIHH